MASPTAAIYGLAGTELSEIERAFFRDAASWGFILFSRNVENPQQVLLSTATAAVGSEQSHLSIEGWCRHESRQSPKACPKLE